MAELHLETTVGQWVAERPETARMFEAWQIDYCCGGDVPLSRACAERRLDPRELFAQLQAASAEAAAEPAANWTAAPLTALCDHIEQTHHTYLKSELPRLESLIGKVASVHGEKHPEIAEVQQAYAALQAELAPHMFKEERILFPAIRAIERSTAPVPLPFGSVANPIGVMEHEHDNAGAALARIRRATADFAVPADACNTYRAMLDGLRRLELDMHQHVHKENNILFPRAIALEQTLGNG